jgi:cobalt-zinc-cadmium efflux system protein
MSIDHHHHHTASTSNSILLWPLLLTAGYALIEAIGGWLTGSLALLGDAGHMLSDSAALALAWLGAWIARKPASSQHSFGFVRAEVIVAAINGLLMLVVIAFIVFEAIERLQTPQPVHGAEVMLIAFIGMLVNMTVAWQLHKGQHNINARAAFLHVMGDLLGSAAALTAGAVIYFTGWLAADPILSIFICALILFSTLKLLSEAVHVLMEGVPPHLDIKEVSAAMTANDQVHQVHSVHIWALSSEVTALSAHVVLQDLQAWHEVLENLRKMLHDRFGIDHVTLQPESVEAFNLSGDGCWLTQPHQH